MPLPPLHTLPAVPTPDWARIFGRRTEPPRPDPAEARLAAVAKRLGLAGVPLAWLRLACTDPAWMAEVETPAWHPTWPGNTTLAREGQAMLDAAEVDAAGAAALGEAAGLWEALWLSNGQRRLTGTGRATVMARAVAALAAVVHHTGGDARAWLAAHGPRS